MSILHLLMLAVICVPQSNYTQSHFDGIWIYNASKSTLPPNGGDLQIVIKENKCIIKGTKTPRSVQWVYILDSEEHKINAANGFQNYRATLAQNVLSISGIVTSAGKTYTVNDQYLLSEDAKVLTHYVVMLGPKGPVVRQRTYNRQ
jgi:hypothetical protein